MNGYVMIMNNKKWTPKLDEAYYCVVESEIIGVFICERFVYGGTPWCIRRIKSGNCFRTKREAQQALKRVKKALRG